MKRKYRRTTRYIAQVRLGHADRSYTEAGETLDPAGLTPAALETLIAQGALLAVADTAPVVPDPDQHGEES